jgi:excisionase family DNA binding protein
MTGQRDAGVILVTVEEAARCLQVSRTTMFRLLKARKIGSVRIGASRRIALAELDAYVSRLQEQQRAGVE